MTEKRDWREGKTPEELDAINRSGARWGWGILAGFALLVGVCTATSSSNGGSDDTGSRDDDQEVVTRSDGLDGSDACRDVLGPTAPPMETVAMASAELADTRTRRSAPASPTDGGKGQVAGALRFVGHRDLIQRRARFR